MVEFFLKKYLYIINIIIQNYNELSFKIVKINNELLSYHTDFCVV